MKKPNLILELVLRMQRTNGTDKATHLHRFEEKERSRIRNREFQGHNAD